MKRAGRIYLLGYGAALFGLYLSLLLPVANAIAATNQSPDNVFFTCGWFAQQQDPRSPSTGGPASADEICSFCRAACDITFVTQGEFAQPGPVAWPISRSFSLPPDQTAASVSVYRILNRGPPVG